MTGFVVFGHGSRVESANESVRQVAAKLSAKMAASGQFCVEPAFLELGQPDLAGAVDKMAAQGASRIIVIPYFLTLGTHLQRDLPKLIEHNTLRHPSVCIEMTAPLDGHPALLEVLLDRATRATVADGSQRQSEPE
jgi:sirohydrochlorin ferrochelatase